jgi:mRNA interferase MazF
MKISPGEFWLANIPYTDHSAAKKRPVLVLWLDAADTVVAVVTSASPRSLADVPLVDWQGKWFARGFNGAPVAA